MSTVDKAAVRAVISGLRSVADSPAATIESWAYRRGLKVAINSISGALGDPEPYDMAADEPPAVVS